MFRLLLCVVIAASSLMAGMYFCARLTKRERVLGEYLDMLREAATRISYRGDSLAEAFSDSAHGVGFRPDLPFAPQWDAVLESRGDPLTADDIDLLREIADGLGSSDIGSQLSYIEFCEAKLSERLDSAKRESSAKAAVYRGLPFAAGMALVILII